MRKVRRSYWIVLPWVWMVPDVSFYYEKTVSQGGQDLKARVEINALRNTSKVMDRVQEL